MLDPPSEEPDAPRDVTQDLARRARDGDEAGFGALFERLAPSLYAWAALRIPAPLHQALDAEDLVQEVWIRALESFSAFDPAKGTFRGWIFGIANHTLLHAMRRAGLRRSKGDGALQGPSTLDRRPAEVTSLSQRLAQNEVLQRTVRKLQELPEDDRRLVALFALEELSARQVAEVLAISEAAAAKRWGRMRERIREQLGPVLGDD